LNFGSIFIKNKKMVKISVSVGELIDKLSILQIKKTKLIDKEKLKKVSTEFDLLWEIAVSVISDPKVMVKYEKLIKINTQLWEVEDLLRKYELEQNFNSDFIKLARDVYFTNDERFEVKNEINVICESEIFEVKEYVNYINR